MNKELKYSGFAALPSDYECPDGQLAASINLIAENDHLKPLHQPSAILKFPNENYKVLYLHITSLYTHYIVLYGTNLYWLDSSLTEGKFLPLEVNTSDLTLLKAFPTIHEINAIGNTLVVLTPDGIHHFLWKDASTGYTYLGTHLPELPLSFGLQGEMIRTDSFSISFDTISAENLRDEFSEDNKSKITSQVLAKVNKFIADNSINAGKFIFPFLVRYAYRLYDGSLTMHSSPILMICSSDVAPTVVWDGEDYIPKSSHSDAKLRVAGMVHTLDYAVGNATRIAEIQHWKDIVRSVDIFISKPIFTYDQNGECSRFKYATELFYNYSICKHINQAADSSKYPIKYQYNRFTKLYSFTFYPSDILHTPNYILEIPKRSADQVKADIRSESNFYFLKSINLEDLTTSRTIIAVEEDYLQSLVAREVMTDDYDSHDTLIPKYSFAYNSRLNIANLKKRLYNSYNMGAMFPFTNGYITDDINNPLSADITQTWGVYFFIKQDGKDIVVKGENAVFGFNTKFLFFYYPNVNAYKAVFWCDSTYYYEIPLEAHGFLNGAFYFGGWNDLMPNNNIKSPTASTDTELTVEIANKIYTSEVNNPFYFPVTGINTVGTGNILGIKSAAKALSQGQFGQFPLYAFTDEGVWALEVSSSGGYSARQPITRDVCINPESITQIDSAVLFATDRGIMMISGSVTNPITEAINTNDFFNILQLPKLDEVLKVNNPGLSSEIMKILGTHPVSYYPYPSPFFKQSLLQQLQILYDYSNQRIMIFVPESKNQAYSNIPCFIFSLKSKTWGMANYKIESAVNSYPDALAMDSSGQLINFSKDNEVEKEQLIVTRPFKLGVPDAYKTIDTIIQRGYFRKGHVKSMLFGSRDLQHWHLVWTSKDHSLRGFRGTPYKYFCIALMCNLFQDESIYGASVQFTPRETRQPH